MIKKRLLFKTTIVALSAFISVNAFSKLHYPNVDGYKVAALVKDGGHYYSNKYLQSTAQQFCLQKESSPLAAYTLETQSPQNRTYTYYDGNSWRTQSGSSGIKLFDTITCSNVGIDKKVLTVNTAQRVNGYHPNSISIDHALEYCSDLDGCVVRLVATSDYSPQAMAGVLLNFNSNNRRWRTSADIGGKSNNGSMENVLRAGFCHISDEDPGSPSGFRLNINSTSPFDACRAIIVN